MKATQVSQRDPRPGSMRDGGWLVGMGRATSMYPTNIGQTTARVRIALGGVVRVQTATHEIGTGVVTLLALMASEGLGVPVERITVELGHSTLPPSPVAGGSNSTASLCAVVAKACKDIRSRIAAAEDGPFHGADPASLQLASDALHDPDDASEPLAKALSRAAPGAIEAYAENRTPSLMRRRSRAEAATRPEKLLDALAL